MRRILKLLGRLIDHVHDRVTDGDDWLTGDPALEGTS